MTTTTVDLRFGDCLDVLRELEASSVDAIVTDPPYGLEFMGADWDGQVPGVAYWTECLRVAKPGAHLLAFGGTRTVHRLAVAIEDAGWEIRDQLTWLYGSGFPKSKTQLKPAQEPIVVARKPFKGSAAANVLEHGTGALNVDACRVAARAGDTWNAGLGNWGYHGGADGYVRGTGRVPPGQGRWPANVVLVHADTCEDGGPCADGCPVAELDRQSGILHSQNPATRASKSKRKGDTAFGTGQSIEYDDKGGASRFFPAFRYQAKAPTSERPKIDGKGWPTVKPLELMRWLVRLVTPPGGLVLDPFAGTGSTLQAARDEGFASLGVERDEFAYRLACQRLGLPEVVPADPICEAIEAAASDEELTALWFAHEAAWSDEYTEAVRARLATLAA